MCRHQRVTPSMLMAAVLLAALLGQLGAAEDPRPHVLVIGDFHSQAARGNASWATRLASRHPQWRFTINASRNRVWGPSLVTPKIKRGERVGDIDWPGLRDEIPALLEASGRVDAILVFVGTNNAGAEIAAQTPPEQFEATIAADLAALRNHSLAADAKLLVMTPLPVVQSRLDQWSTERFAGGEAVCRHLTEALRAVATTESLMLFDAYQRGWDDADGGGPGRLLGSSGWIMRGWAHGIFVNWVDEAVQALDPTPADPAAYAAWQAERESNLALDRILSETGAAEADHASAALPAALGNRDRTLIATVPAEALSGPHLSILVKPAESDAIASVAAGNAAFGNERPFLQIGEQRIHAEVAGSALLDEAQPGSSVPMDRYGINSGKWRPFPVTASTAGARRWLVMRFPLPAATDRSAGAQLHLCLNHNQGATQILANGRPSEHVRGTWAQPSVHVLQGGDANYDPLSATWTNRGNGSRWTGGAASSAERLAALEAFLAGDVPASVRARAQALLAD